ncbi:methyl-accepting chemotaxis protein [Paenibacillus sp. FA6]|uniref:methyl-accepting chemotaxis protein n=1 Tax=Paenibacillus sp. FA6 TaxID=3413029 RepID=UPI003F660A24
MSKDNRKRKNVIRKFIGERTQTGEETNENLKKDNNSSESKDYNKVWKQIRKFNPSRSVGVKLFLIFFTAIVAFVLLVGIMSYIKAKNTIENTAANANKQTIIQTSEKLDIILKQFEDVSMQLFFDTEMQQLIGGLTESDISDYDLFVATDKINGKLTSQVNTNSAINGIFIVPPDAEMRPITSGNISTDMETVRSQPWFGLIKDKNGTMWVPTEAGVQGEPTFKFVRSLKSLTGMSKTFVLVMEFKQDVLEEQLRGVNLGTGSKLEIDTSDGQVVASSVVGEAGNQTEFTFMADQEELSNDLNATDEGGTEVLAVYNTLKTTDWKVIGAIPTSELVKDARGILTFTIISAISVAVLAVLIGLLLVRMIARPLVNLRNLLIEGSKGDLRVRSKHVSNDEIGELSGSFNVMMEQITNLVNQTNNTAQDVLDTASELSDASNKTALSAREIAVATEEIANGASSLATEAERGNELTEHISQQMQTVISANNEMGKAARDVENSSELGTSQLNDLLDQTHQTENMVGSLMKKVDGLKETTMSVNKVLEVLQNVTKQTNILSLNATIEAARAGAAGKGFMVVADEIRQLADQSRKSIDMVGQITDRIMGEMNETVDALSEAYPLFQHQMTAVKETNDIFVSVQGQMGDFIQRLDSVTQSIEGLSQTQSILSDAMSNVSAVAEESSATSEEVASLSNEQQSIGNQLVQLSGKLENVSTELKETLSRFTV